MRYETSIIINQKSGKFTKNPCNYCGDGVVSTATDSSSKRYETCDTDSSGNIILPGNTSFNKSCTSITSTDASGTFIVPFSGIYEIKLDGAQGGNGGHGYKSEKNKEGSGGASGSGGTQVTAQYYLTAGTTLSYTLGRNGIDGTGNKSTVQRKGGSGGKGGEGYNKGNDGSSGKNGTDGSGIICPKDSGGGGGGGGAGGSSAVLIGSTVLMSAASGAGGDGGQGGKTGCYSGGKGGAGGESVGSNSYQSGSGTGWAYYTGWDTASTSGTGWIQITMKKYAPCDSCTLETNTSNFVNCN